MCTWDIGGKGRNKKLHNLTLHTHFFLRLLAYLPSETFKQGSRISESKWSHFYLLPCCSWVPPYLWTPLPSSLCYRGLPRLLTQLSLARTLPGKHWKRELLLDKGNFKPFNEYNTQKQAHSCTSPIPLRTLVSNLKCYTHPQMTYSQISIHTVD